MHFQRSYTNSGNIKHIVETYELAKCIMETSLFRLHE